LISMGDEAVPMEKMQRLLSASLELPLLSLSQAAGGQKHRCAEHRYLPASGTRWPWVIAHPGFPQTRTCAHWGIRFLTKLGTNCACGSKWVATESLCSLLDGRVRRQGLELVTRYSIRILPRKQQDLPSSWGTSIIRLHMFQTDAGRIVCTRPCSAATWPLVIKRQRLPRLGLSTLNSMAFGFGAGTVPNAWSASRGRSPDTTQNSLPVADQALLDGVLTCKVPMKGFKVVIYISFPFPKLCLAQLMQPLRVRVASHHCKCRSPLR